LESYGYPNGGTREHGPTAPQIIGLAQEIQELSDGYAIHFLNERGKLMVIAQFMEVEPNGGSLWLRLTVSEGVKEILQTALFESIENKVALKQFMQTGATAIIMKHHPNH